MAGVGGPRSPPFFLIFKECFCRFQQQPQLEFVTWEVGGNGLDRLAFPHWLSSGTEGLSRGVLKPNSRCPLRAVLSPTERPYHGSPGLAGDSRVTRDSTLPEEGRGSDLLEPAVSTVE